MSGSAGLRHVAGRHALPLIALFTIIAVVCPQGLLLVATLTTLTVGAAVNHG